MDFKMTADYHTHTIYSDGVGTIEENVARAVELGLKTIGISDHGFNHVKNGVKREKVAEMRAEIERLRKVYPQIEILLGIEANLVNLNGELDMKPEDFANFDYCIFGIHYFTYGKGVKDSFKFNMHNLLLKPTKKYIEKVTDSYIKAIEKYPVKVVVHPNYVVPVNTKRLADACAKKGVLIEFNGKRTTFTPQQAQELIDSKAKFIIGSDAHSPSRIAECSVPKEFIEKYNIPLDRIVNIEVTEQNK